MATGVFIVFPPYIHVCPQSFTDVHTYIYDSIYARLTPVLWHIHIIKSVFILSPPIYARLSLECYIYTYIYVELHVYIHIYTYTCTYIYSTTYIHIYIHIYIYTCRVYLHIYIYTYIHIYMYRTAGIHVWPQCWNTYIWLQMCLYYSPHIYVCTQREQRTRIERWGAGVEYHFQEFQWALRPVVNGT